METLVLNGKMYVKASKAAKDLGYTSDYVGQLCRSGNVDAHLVGRTWYVNPDTLTVHKTEKKRSARLKAREYAKKAIEESRVLKIKETKNSYRNIAIRYEGDKADLIPEVRRVTAQGSEQYAVVEPEVEKDDSLYQVVNKDKKIVMSGTLTVIDAEDLVESTDTVILKPNFRKLREKVISKEHKQSKTVDKASEVKVTVREEVPSFAERLEKYDTEVKEVDQVEAVPEVIEPRAVAPKTSRVEMWMLPCMIILLLSLGVLSVYFEAKLVWSESTLTVRYEPNWGAVKW